VRLLIGVLGILCRAKQMAQLQSIKPEIGARKTKVGFFVVPDLERRFWRRQGSSSLSQNCRETLSVDLVGKRLRAKADSSNP
jgi:hypothetical protein